MSTGATPFLLEFVFFLGETSLSTSIMSGRKSEMMWIIAKIKVAVSVDKQRTLIRIYMEKYNSV